MAFSSIKSNWIGFIGGMRPLLGLCVLALCGLVSTVEARTVEFKGLAYDLKTGKLLYTEIHREVWAAGAPRSSRVSYVDPAGKVFARKQVDFAPGRLSPNFRMVDTRVGMEESATRRGGKIEVFGRVRAGRPDKRASLPAANPPVIDVGFHYFILNNWRRLLSGERVSFLFLVPLRAGPYRFHIRKVATDAKTVTLRMSIANPALALIASHVDVIYAKASRRILEYRGISNVKRAGSGNYRARIVYRY